MAASRVVPCRTRLVLRDRLRVAPAGGFTLAEVIVVMALLGIILAALTGLLVTGLRTQVDMSNRVQAQQEARLAMDKLRREIHCASSVTSPTAASFTIALGSYCPTAGGAATSVTWCTRAGAAAGTWSVFRVVGGSCTGGKRWAAYLSTSSVFTYPAQATGELKKIRVRLPVQLKMGTRRQKYTLEDDIVLRNSTRAP